MAHQKTQHEWQDCLAKHDAELLTVKLGRGLSSTWLSIRCNKCGEVEEEIRGANLIRRKQVCVACNGREDYTTESTRQLIIDNGGIYLGGEVIDRDSLIRLNCPGCLREIEKRAQDIRRRPQSCDLCRRELGAKTTLEQNDNLSRAKRIAEERGGKCLTMDQQVRADDKLQWECSLGHRWVAQLTSVDSGGSWCPDCATSRGERMVRALFEATFGASFPQSRPDFLKQTKLHLDGYNAELALAFEVNGIQHYQLSRQFHGGEDDLLAQQERDRKKIDLCAAHGVDLITIPYWIVNDGLMGLRAHLAKVFLGRGLKPQNDPLSVEINPRAFYDTKADPDYLKFKRIVEDKGGHFAQDDYLGKTVKLTVTCAEGHNWSARPYLIMAGHWCPECAGNLPLEAETVDNRLQEFGWRLDEENEQGFKAIDSIRMRCPNDHLVIRSWNRWQQQTSKRKPTCQQCDREARAREFVERMKARDILVDIDISTYNGEGQPVKGICARCGKETILRVEQWKNHSLSPCCKRAMPPYHACHAKRALETSA